MLNTDVTSVLVHVTVPDVADALTGDAPELGLIVNTIDETQPEVGCVTFAVYVVGVVTFAVAVFVAPIKPPPPLVQLIAEPPGLTLTLIATTELEPQPNVGVCDVPAVIVGIAIFCVTVTVRVVPLLGQPLELFVTTKVYTPAVATVGDCNDDVNDDGPLHKYETPDDGLPVKPTVVFVQFKTPLGDANAVGVITVVLMFAAITEVEVQPLSVFSTLTVKLPPLVLVTPVDDVFGEDILEPPGPLHVILYNGVLAVVDNVMAEFKQVITPPVLGVLVVVLLIGAIVIVVKFLQPLIVDVTLMLYVPPTFTPALAELTPLTTLGPDHVYVTPLEGLPLKITVGVAQFNTVFALMLKGEGIVVLIGTVTVATFVDVQPAPEVTVKEKGPGPLTVGLAVVLPLTMPEPLHT